MDAITHEEAVTESGAATDGQRKLITRFASDAVERAVKNCSLTKIEAQSIIEGGDLLVTALHAAVATTLRELSQQKKFISEEVTSHSEYSSAYAKKTLAQQCDTLQKVFPELKKSQLNESILTLPAHAEGWFAIPRWESIGSTYHEAVETVLSHLAERFTGFVNHYAKKPDLGYIRQSQCKEDAVEHLLLGGDFHILPAQFGLRHRGRSAHRSDELMPGNEFGLGVFEVGVMLLTHPERLMNCRDLWISCPGDEFTAPTTSHARQVPYFFTTASGKLEFGTQLSDEPRKEVGIASGFLKAYK